MPHLKTDRPILFSAPMIRALLDGRKTQTRRIIKFAGIGNVAAFERVARDLQDRPVYEMRDGASKHYARPAAPGFVDYHYSTPIGFGDRLWVREAHALLPRTAYRMSIGTGTIAQIEHPSDGYSAAVFREGFDRSGAPRWRPSIHMPRWASRLTLTVTDVRVERLQDISEADAIAEGVERHKLGWLPYATVFYEADGVIPANYHRDPRHSYMQLWNQINGPGAWDANPWVAAYTFTVHPCNIDRMEAIHG